MGGNASRLLGIYRKDPGVRGKAARVVPLMQDLFWTAAIRHTSSPAAPHWPRPLGEYPFAREQPSLNND